jgi:hypothetical protein
MSLVHEITYEFKQMYRHENVSTSTKDLLGKDHKSEQALNLHMIISDRIFYR